MDRFYAAHESGSAMSWNLLYYSQMVGFRLASPIFSI